MNYIGDTIQLHFKKYVGVQSWKAAHLPTLEIRVEQKENHVMKGILMRITLKGILKSRQIGTLTVKTSF